MKRFLIALLLVAAALGQTNPESAQYPGAIPSADDQTYLGNFANTELNEALDTTETGIDVVDASAFIEPSVVAICPVGECSANDFTNVELVKVTGITGNTLTVVRGFNGTTGIAHSIGEQVQLVTSSYLINKIWAELIAVQTALGTDTDNVDHYETVEDEGTPLAQRSALNFTGTGVTCTDDSGNDETDCDIPGAGSGAASYEESFAAATTLTIEGTEHNIGHEAITWSCWDDGTPKVAIVPEQVTVDAVTFDVVFTFNPADSGSCVVTGNGGSDTAHAILSARHSDSVAGSVTRGDLIVGTVTPNWERLALGAVTNYLRSNGDDAVWSAILDGDLPGTIARDSELHSQSHVIDGGDHTASGLTIGQYLRATGATTFAFASILDGDLPSSIARDSELHAQSHELATTSGLGADHTTSGLTAGQVLRATSATAAAFQAIADADLPSTISRDSESVAAGDVSGSLSGGYQIDAGAVAAPELATAFKTDEKCWTVFDLNADLPATADIPSIWPNRSRAVTLTEIWCESDSGTATINVQRDDGTPADICSSALTCATGGDTCAPQGAEDNFSIGQELDHVTVTSPSGTKRINVCVLFTID